MALNTTEEAQIRALIAQNAALLSLAGNEATITSKLAATKVSLADLPAATSAADADILLLRQGTTDKRVASSVLMAGAVKSSEFTQSLAANGWQRLPSGLIIQWQVYSAAAATNYLVNFPIAFPNSHFLTALTANDDNSDISTDATYMKVSNSQWRLYNWSGGGNAIAAIHLGY